jgi:integrase
MTNHATSEPTEFPVRVTGEPTNITIYKETHGGETRFVVSYYNAACARQRRRCSNYQKADALAAKLSKEIKKGGWDLLTLRGSEKHSYERAIESLRSCQIPLDIAVYEYVESRKVLNGSGLLEAARAFVQKQDEKIVPKQVSEVASELLEELTCKMKSRWYLRDIRTRLSRFAAVFKCPLQSVASAEIERYIRDLDGKERYKNNVLQAINTLFVYGKKRKYVSRDHRGTSEVSRYEVVSKEIEVYTPAELQTMLGMANPQVQLALALTSFAGIRGGELGRLDWQDIKFEAGFIRVKASVAKTKMRRVPPIPDNLKAWLLLYRQESGPVVPYKNVYNQYLKVAKKAGIDWKRNAPRHSFASYRTALIKNHDQVAMEAGHSKQMLLSNYFQVVSEQDAKAWFAIFPPADLKAGTTTCTDRSSESKA